ncbi:aspartate/glutamate racemase family protein [Arthrobacter sp. M4]|uniref:aspartate/glutamate racemase family protein n=1 Tax=Arthrobacter sp. M4 TaxID=218160 RepID=UPI001CDCBFA5|nr:aspartate/glutamate racemase family protein [Arthrobacter sp. M4]MCA4134759.1 aspartate/glutamate racemase family protein [Arthrobacter sp. M4]
MGTRNTVLLVNPNSNSKTTAMMAELAAAQLEPHGFDVVGLTAAAGPAMIIDPGALAESQPHVRSAVLDYLSGPDLSGRDGGSVAGVIVAAIGDPGRAELHEALELPVVGIGQGSIHAAARGNRKFGMATSTPLLAESLEKLVAAHGKSELFTGVRLTDSEPLVLAADPERQYLELAAAVEQSTLDGAEAVIIAGGPLSATALRLAQTTTAEIVQPVPSACRLLLERLGVAVP